MEEYNHAERSPLQSGQTTHDTDVIPRARDHIRILRLFPGTGDADLEGNITTQHVREEHNKKPGKEALVQYEALSYYWGEKQPARSIKILDDSQSYHITIRPNLDNALRQLRYKDRIRCLWVDAICINQKDEAEKSEQIPQMSWVYSRARSVAVWLGQEENNSGQALEFVGRFLRLDDFDHLVRDSLKSKDWAALAALMRRSWFSRRWIIQEIAVAKEATLYCGRHQIPWREFADGISLFASKRHELRELFRESAAHSHHPDYLGELSELGAIRLVYASDNLFRRNQDGKIVEHLFSLESLMSSMSAFEASDPRDVLYAIIWLANDAKPVDRKAPFAQGMRPNHLRSDVITPLTSPSGRLVKSRLDNCVAENDEIDSPLSPLDKIANDKAPAQVDRTDTQTGARGSLSDGPRTDEPQTYDEQEDPPTNGFLQRATTEIVKPDGATRRKLEQCLMPLMEKRIDKKRLFDPNDPKGALSVAGGMWKDAMRNRNIYVDYSKSVYEVCKDFLEFVMHRTQSLDMLCRPWAPDDPSLPSWIPPLSRGAFAPSPRQVHRRVNADPLVGEPGNGLKPYRASSSRQAHWRIDPLDGHTLHVSGFQLDVIKEKCLPASAGIIPGSWLAAGGWKDTSQLPPEEFWRTIVGNRTSHGRRPPSHWRRICLDAFQRRPIRGDFNTTETILYDCPSVVREFLERVQCVVWSRRLVVLQYMPESLALVPSYVKKGDIICILDGCSVPVVLRKFVDGKSAGKRHLSCNDPHCPRNAAKRRGSIAGNDLLKIRLNTRSFSGEHYEFIGEAYVHGMMDGEAFNELRERNLKPQMFNLR